MSGRLVVVALVAALGGPAAASFHDARIDEVVTSVGGDATAQFVRIRMLSGGQNQVFTNNTIIAAYDENGQYLADLVVPDHNVTSGANASWIAMSPAAASVFSGSVSPDFGFQPGRLLPVDAGMVCFGVTPIRTNPAVAVDCVAYGAFCGSSPGGAPVGFTPRDHALRRTSNAHANSAFDCQASFNPRNSSGASLTTSVGASACTPASVCSTPVTTTTLPSGVTTTTSTTTTTLPLVSGGAPLGTDCFGAWRILGAGRKPSIRCKRRNAACDQGTGPDCFFRAQLCFADAAPSAYRNKCRPGGVTAFALRGVSANAVDRANAESVLGAVAALGGTRSGSTVTFSAPLAASTCTAAFPLTVPVRGKKPGTRTLRSQTTAGKSDADGLKLVCVP